MRPTSQSFLRQPLSAVFAHGSHVRVLRVLSRHGGELSASALIDRTRLTRPSVLASLEQLTVLGYVEALGVSHRLYRIDHRHPLAPALTALFAAEEQRFQDILGSLRSAATEAGAEAAWLYGSVARAEDGPSSDVDIVAVVSDDAESIKTKLRETTRDRGDALRFSASLIVLDHAQLARLIEDNDPWCAAMIEDAIPLVGPDPATLVGRLTSNKRRYSA